MKVRFFIVKVIINFVFIIIGFLLYLLVKCFYNGVIKVEDKVDKDIDKFVYYFILLLGVFNCFIYNIIKGIISEKFVLVKKLLS